MAEAKTPAKAPKKGPVAVDNTDVKPKPRKAAKSTSVKVGGMTQVNYE